MLLARTQSVPILVHVTKGSLEMESTALVSETTVKHIYARKNLPSRSQLSLRKPYSGLVDEWQTTSYHFYTKLFNVQ